MTYFIPDHVTQQDGSRCAGSNCWAAVGAWLYAAATGGAGKLTPTEFRQMAGGGSGRAGASGCRSGFEGDLVKGLDKLGVKSSILELRTTEAVKLLATERRAVFALATDYELWPEGKDCLDGDFDGNHMVGVIGSAPPRVMNPLCQRYQRIGMDALMAAADKFARDHGRNRVLVVRVKRPLPAGLAEDKALIETQRAVIEEHEEAMAAARSLILQAAEVLAG